MELDGLYISRDKCTRDSPVTGSISFTDPNGKVEIKLTKQHCKLILEVVAEALIEQATEAANNLKGAVIDAVDGRQLEYKD